MNEEQALAPETREAIKRLRYWIHPVEGDLNPSVAPADIQLVLDALTAALKLDEERRRALNDITVARDELRDAHAQCALVRRYPEGQAVDLPVPMRSSYLRQSRAAADSLEVLLEKVRAAGFYVTRDEMHFDIDATPRDDSHDPPWHWVGDTTPQPDDALHEQLQEDAARDAEREPQPEFPDADDESPDRPVYETDPLKE